MPVDTLLFVVVLLLLKVRLRLVPESNDEKLGIDEGVDNDMVEDSEADIDEATGNDAEVGRCVRIELEEIWELCMRSWLGCWCCDEWEVMLGSPAWAAKVVKVELVAPDVLLLEFWILATAGRDKDWLESSEGASGVLGGVANGEMVSLAGSGGRGDNGWSATQKIICINFLSKPF